MENALEDAGCANAVQAPGQAANIAARRFMFLHICNGIMSLLILQKCFRKLCEDVEAAQPGHGGWNASDDSRAT